ncbi:MAG: M56 family metallopeptidase [bacterium]|nr:M56 family metallopeptidase [bacterium]
MGELLYFLLQSSLLIGMVLLFRKVGRQRLSPQVRYMLWLIPMFRLLLPFPVIELAGNMENWHPYTAVMQIEQFVEEIPSDKLEQEENGTSQAGSDSETNSPKQKAQELLDKSLLEGQGPSANLSKENVPREAMENKERFHEGVLDENGFNGNPSNEDTLHENTLEKNLADRPLLEKIQYAAWLIWLMGVVFLGSVFAFQNYRFFARIQREGQKLSDVPFPIYYLKGLQSPCLAGLFHPVILVNEAALSSPEVQSMVILHEQMHWKQKDHVWTFVRNCLCIVYWFHPLVWIGAKACRKDAELSCDSLVTAGMKKQEKIQYGMTLLNLLEQGQAKQKTYPFLNGTTTMTGGKREMEERISGIAKRTKTKRGLAVLLILILSLTTLFGCTKIQDVNQVLDIEDVENIENAGLEPTIENAETVQNIENMASSGQNEEKEITKKAALFSGATTLGADEPRMVYLDQEVMIFSGYFGLVVLQYGNLEKLEQQEVQIVDTLDLKEIGCNMTQGDSAAVIRVSRDGRQVYLYRMDSDVLYRYDRSENRLYQGKVSMLPQEDTLYQVPENMTGNMQYLYPGEQMEEGTDGQKNMPYEEKNGQEEGNAQNSIPYGKENESDNGPKNMPYKEDNGDGQKNVPYIEEVQHGGYFSYSGWDIGSLRFIMDGDMVLPIWTDASKTYMKNLKQQLDNGVDTIVDEGWDGALPRKVQNLKGGEPQWQQVVSQVDENGDKIENQYEWISYFEKLDGTRRIAFRSFDELLYTYGENLIFRYNQTIYVQKEYEKNPFLSFSAGGGSTTFYSGDDVVGVYNGQAETISFYDEKFQLLHTVGQIRLEEYSEGYYCVVNLDTGLYGYLDNRGNTAIPFQYSLAYGFHNGYAAVLTGADAEVYYENEYKDRKVKMFDNKGGLWGIIDRDGNYAVQPEEKYSNAFDRTDLEGHTTQYVNGPVRFETVREDGTVDFVRVDDQFVLYTVKVQE